MRLSLTENAKRNVELILHWLVNSCFPSQIYLLADVGRKQTIDQRLKPLQGDSTAIENPIKIVTRGKKLFLPALLYSLCISSFFLTPIHFLFRQSS